MCSPTGSCTLNSLMKVATLRLLTTVHSYSLTFRIDCGTTILRFSFTFTWQPKRQWSWICLRVKKPTSVGKIEPPPSTTRHLHWPQLPLPPQAEGRYTFCSARVLMRVLPTGTVSSLSSLMVIFTSPLGMSLLRTQSSKATSRSTMPRKTAMLRIIVVVMSMRSKFNTHKRHKGNTHQTSDYERDAHALQGFGNLGIT